MNTDLQNRLFNDFWLGKIIFVGMYLFLIANVLAGKTCGMMVIWYTIPVLAVVLVARVLLIVFGWRGRVIGDPVEKPIRTKAGFGKRVRRGDFNSTVNAIGYIVLLVIVIGRESPAFWLLIALLGIYVLALWMDMFFGNKFLKDKGAEE